DDGVVPEVVGPGTAVFLRDAVAEQAHLPGFGPHLTRDDPVLFPLVVEGGDFPLEELGHRFSEEVVVGVEQVSFHTAAPECCMPLLVDHTVTESDSVQKAEFRGAAKPRGTPGDECGAGWALLGRGSRSGRGGSKSWRKGKAGGGHL